MVFAQAFRVNITLSLPDNVLNPGDAIPLGISVAVMVEAGDTGARKRQVAVGRKRVG